MKLNNHESNEHSHKQEVSRWSERIKRYFRNLYNSDKYRKMSHGSHDILRSMSWARGENWRRNHPKSLNKQHK